MRLSILLLCLLPISGAAQAAEVPNILWITSEDNGPHLGCYGDQYAVTPNLDRLAARGMRYLHASSNAPVCAPARTTIITGVYPPSLGAEHMRSHVPLPANIKMYPQFLREAGYYCTNNSKKDYNVVEPGEVWHLSSGRAHWKSRQADQPFFAIFNHTISHESQIRNAIKDADRIHDPAQARVPAYHPDTPEVRKNWAQYYDRITMMDKLAGNNLRELAEAGLDEDTIIFYYGDHGSGMPRSKRWPYNSGLNVPMIVYFPEKWRHLAPADYEPGGVSDRLVGFVDLAPTVLSIADVKPPQWMQGHAFAGSHQQDEPEYSYGFRGRMDERYDMVRVVRGKQYIYIRNYMPHKPWGQHVSYMFQTQTTQVWHRMFQEGALNAAQARFWQTKPAEELYDLQADPDEVNNLAASPQHQQVLARMRDAQQDWARRIKDVGFLSEWELHQRSQGATPYEMGHDPQRYDLESIMAAANLATSLQADDLPKILALLDDKDPGVRYWGAIGALTQPEAIKTGHDQLLKALQDDSPIVRVTAAEALGRFGSRRDVRAALPVLLKYAAPEEDVFLGIASWNAIDHMDQRARSIREQLQALGDKPLSSASRTSGYAARLKKKTLEDLTRK